MRASISGDFGAITRVVHARAMDRSVHTQPNVSTLSRTDRAAEVVISAPSRSARRRVFGALTALVLATNVAACSSADDELGTSREALTSSQWELPEEIRAAGAQVRVRYDDAPSWTGRCPTDDLTPGGQVLGEFLRQQFPQISSVGGFSCRQNTANSSKTSVHGTGRALDIMLPESSAEGDEVANYLVAHAQEIGIQLLIWNHIVWRANGTNEKRYTGPNPHTDHVHAEINEDAANQQTPFFTNGGRVSTPTPGTGRATTPGVTLPTNPTVPTEPLDGYDPYNPYPQGTIPSTPGNPYPTNPYPTNPTDPYPPVDPSRPGSIPTLPNGTPSTGSGLPTGSTTPAPTTNVAPPPAAPVTAPPDTSIADAPSGVPDSLGTGVRTPKKKSKAKPQVESGCAAAPGSTGKTSSFGTIALALAAVLLRRRRST